MHSPTSKVYLPRWLFLLTFISLLIAGMITVFYAYINWEGRRQWNELLAGWRAENQPSTWSDVLPPSVPDAQNFCATPLLACLNQYNQLPETTDIQPKEPALNAKIKALQVGDLNVEDQPSLSSRFTKQFTDLPRWRDYYRKSDLFSPWLKSHGSPPVSVLEALHRFQPELAELILAAERPEARFQVQYGNSAYYFLQVPHVEVSGELTGLMALRAIASLHLNDSNAAWKNLTVLFKLNQALGKEPFLYCQQWSLIDTSTAIDVIWEGLALSAWKKAELEKISHALKEIDLITQYHKSLRGKLFGETFCGIDYLKEHGKLPYYGSDKILSDPTPPLRLLLRILPQGCYDIAKVNVGHSFSKNDLPLINEKNRSYDFSAESRVTYEKDHLHWYSPPDLIRSNLDIYAKELAELTVETQNDLNLARIACELELYRSHTGNYPKELDELGITFPSDPISGKPYHYKPIVSGRYEIWGEGWPTAPRVYGSPFDIQRNQGNINWIWAYPDKKPSP